MSNPNGLDRLALAVLAAGTAIAVLGACQGPTTVIGRINGKSPAVKLGAKKPIAANPQILVKFKAQLAANEMTTFRAAFGLRNVSTIPQIGVFVEEVTNGRPVGEVLRELQASPMVEYAEPNQEIRIEP